LIDLAKRHDAVPVPRFNLQAPNSKGKEVVHSGDLLAFLTFDIAYDAGTFATEGWGRLSAVRCAGSGGIGELIREGEGTSATPLWG